MLEWYARCRRVSVYVCLCLQQAGIVSQRLNLGSRKQCHMIARTLVFLPPKILEKIQRVTPNGDTNEVRLQEALI